LLFLSGGFTRNLILAHFAGQQKLKIFIHFSVGMNAESAIKDGLIEAISRRNLWFSICYTLSIECFFFLSHVPREESMTGNYFMLGLEGTT